jgi:L-alanine-DL-glutamate epimerase-like enolase superfamily enzyme
MHSSGERICGVAEQGDSVKISAYQTHAVRVPVDDMAFGEVIGTYVVLRLRTDDGVEGVGYATGLTAGAVKPLISVLEAYLDQLIGRNPLDTESISTPQVKFGSSPRCRTDCRSSTFRGPPRPGLGLELDDAALRDLSLNN